MNQIKFLVDNSADINSNDLINLRTFYTPVIGSLGLALYHHLYDLYNNDKLAKYNLSETSEFLVLSEEELRETKNKLEGIGLIKTFQDKEGNLLFKLLKPLNANEIVKNPLVSSILKNKFGEFKFNKLIKEKALYYYECEKYNDVSKNFFEVFANEKIELNQDECFDFKLVNENELVDNLTSEQYICHYTRRELSPSQILMIKKVKSLNFKDKAINNFVKYSLSVNNAIVCNYIEKIANDFAKRNLFEADLIDNELSQVILFKNKNNANYEKNSSQISNISLEDGLAWDD
ncbi:DnaD domain protein [Mycoplasmopsis arginini]|uniref:DnaD domain protein n=1 Tax=Mycoplasmopsis arginini TaxID=2094 RepID=UPI003518A3F0